MRLHLLGLPHTVTSDAWSHCAFTGKVKRFAPMMQSVGYEVVHYGNEGADSGANEQVNILTAAELEGYVGKHDPASPSFYQVDVGSRLYRHYNARLQAELGARVAPGDAICLPFGLGHEAALRGPLAAEIEAAYWVETGIGYEELGPLGSKGEYRVFESSAWMHWHLGRRFAESPPSKRDRHGSDYHWVIPNYYDLSDWEPSFERGTYLAYFGRISVMKGANEVLALAKARPELDIVLCGQGDPAPFLAEAKNLRYQPPIAGKARSAFLRGALAVLAPSRYPEPFCGAAVEAQLCGTPVISSPFGAFRETVLAGVTGFRCHTLGDFCAAVDRVKDLDRAEVRRRAERYDMFRIAPLYRDAFEQIADRGREGWYSRRSRLAEAAAPAGA